MEKYMIREAARQVGVETHVLRYWEKELVLDIPKNDMGHRYYTAGEIAMLRQIKYLKDQGFHLKSIRLLGEHVSRVAQMEVGRLHSLRDRLNGELMAEAAAMDEMTGNIPEERVQREKKQEETQVHTEKGKEPDTAVFYGVKGTPAGIKTGKIAGKKIMPVETGYMPEESKLLELEPIEEGEPAKSVCMFNVVQGGRMDTEKEFSLLRRNEAADTNLKEREGTDAGEVPEAAMDSRMEQFRAIMSDIIGQALRENNKELAKDVSSGVSDKVLKEMDFMMRSQQEEEEERYRKLDETIRSFQRSRQEAAASKESVGKRRKGLFLLKKEEN